MTDAFLIMALGMGGVILFLFVLIILMQLLVTLLPPTEQELNPAPRGRAPRAPITSPSPSADQTLIAVLQAAVVAYEADRGH